MAALLSGFSARAADAPENRFWMGVGLGVAIEDSLRAERQAFLFRPEGFAPSLKLESFYTNLKFDFGLTAIQQAGGSYVRPNGLDGRFGGVFSVGPFVRWRFIHMTHGVVYVQGGPTWTAVTHSEYMRRDLAMARSVDAEDVEPVTHALAVSASTGVLIAARDDLFVNIAADLFAVETELLVGDDRVEYDRARGGLSISLLWTL